MPAAEAEPLGGEEIAALFEPFDEATEIALAVSGGADSLALLVAMERWLDGRKTRPRVTVLTVDHRLRPDTDLETAMVCDAAAARGIAYRILVCGGPHPAGNIEAAARAARYRLLLQAARELGASHLLLAHHRDDQAETFLMRLARGSGIFGLAGMRPVVFAGDVAIARPFLGVPKARLAATTAAAALMPVEDPMNVDPRFCRTRIRRLAPVLAARGMGADRLAAMARHFAEAADALDAWADRVIGAAIELDALAVARIDVGRFFAEPPEVRARVLARLLLAIGGADYSPGRDHLATLDGAMSRHRRGRFKRTMAGTVVEWRGRNFVCYRETGRLGLPSVPASPGFTGIWDNRFRVQIDSPVRQDLRLGALGEEGRLEVGATRQTAPPAAIAALPAIRSGPRIVAVPLLSYGEPTGVTVRSIVAERLAKPSRFPGFTDAA